MLDIHIFPFNTDDSVSVTTMATPTNDPPIAPVSATANENPAEAGLCAGQLLLPAGKLPKVFFDGISGDRYPVTRFAAVSVNDISSTHFSRIKSEFKKSATHIFAVVFLLLY